MPTSRMTRFTLAGDGSTPRNRSTRKMNATYARRLLGLTIFVLAGVVWVVSASLAILAANHDGLLAGWWGATSLLIGLGALSASGLVITLFPARKEVAFR